MKCAYLLAFIRETDSDALAAYRSRVADVVAKGGGTFLVKGGASEQLEGEQSWPRAGLLRFPDMQTAKDWYFSPEYQELLALRQEGADTILVLAEGLGDEEGDEEGA